MKFGLRIREAYRRSLSFMSNLNASDHGSHTHQASISGPSSKQNRTVDVAVANPADGNAIGIFARFQFESHQQHLPAYLHCTILIVCALPCRYHYNNDVQKDEQNKGEREKSRYNTRLRALDAGKFGDRYDAVQDNNLFVVVAFLDILQSNYYLSVDQTNQQRMQEVNFGCC